MPSVIEQNNETEPDDWAPAFMTASLIALFGFFFQWLVAPGPPWGLIESTGCIVAVGYLFVRIGYMELRRN